MKADRKDFIGGMIAGLPIALLGIADGVLFGILAQKHLTLAESIVMSASIASGMAQFLLVPLYDHSTLMIMVTLTLLVSIRYMILGAAISPLFRHKGSLTTYGSLFLLFDENWALTMNHIRKGPGGPAYFVGSGLSIYLTWIIGTAAGYFFPLAMKTDDLSFIVFLIFAAILVGQWQGKSSLLLWCISAIASGVASYFFSSDWSFVVGVITGLSLLLLQTAARRVEA
jgi:predicted branched-subunit amino acid permease